MSNEPQQQEYESIELAQPILELRYKGAVRLEAGASLRGSNRSHVVRCRVVAGPAHSPESVVVKRALPEDGESYDPDATHGPAVRLFNEWASLQFLGECFGADAPLGADSPVPRLYGGDRAGGVIVMEDLGAGVGLDSLLLGDEGTAAENALIELFQVVGRMHAVSIGQATRYQELRAALGPPAPSIFSDVAEAARSIRITLETLGLTPHAQLDTELMACVQRASAPGPFNAFIHCDPCPDNCLVTAHGLKLLDFEFGQFGLALWDGAYARSHFPTCWCVNRIPPALVERVEQAYRQELTHGCPQADDDRQFGPAVVVGCACALFSTLRWAMPGLLEQDSQWGIATQRQRVLVRLGALAQATQYWDELPCLGATAQQIEGALRNLWLPEMAEMPLYPAFQ